MMKYAKRTVRSDEGMSQEQAFLTLQNDPTYKPGTKIVNFRRRGSRWVAELLEPKTAGPPPFAEGGDEGGESDAPEAPSDDEGDDSEDEGGEPDGPPGLDEGGDDKPEEGKKPAGDEAILHVLTEILHALTGGGIEDGMGGPDALGPGPDGPPGPPPPKPHGGPPGMGGPPGGGHPPAGRPMKPGEAPPGSTPIGAPAFSSTRTANPMAPAPVPAAGGAPGASAPASPVGGAKCAQCGYPEPCPIHGAGAQGPIAPVASLAEQVAANSHRTASITLKTVANGPIEQAVREVRPVVEAHGYKIKQAKTRNGVHAILATRR